MLFFLALCIVGVVAARVVFPKEIQEELHEELEELKELGHHGGPGLPEKGDPPDGEDEPS